MVAALLSGSGLGGGVVILSFFCFSFAARRIAIALDILITM